ncbi:MAG: hypothetical protein WBZ19_14975, partial [Chthoniobacterales bacterium]
LLGGRILQQQKNKNRFWAQLQGNSAKQAANKLAKSSFRMRLSLAGRRCWKLRLEVNLTKVSDG